MIIYSDSKIKGMAYLLCAISIAAAVVFHISFHSYPITGLIFTICAFWASRFWVALGRTFSFDADGITVTFLSKSKKYNWSQFRHIRLYEDNYCIGYKETSYFGIEFCQSAKPRTPTIFSPSTYCMLFHPFSYVFLTFPSPEHERLTVEIPSAQLPINYLVDKDSVLAFLADLKIPLE